MALSKTAFRLPWKRGSMSNHGVQTEPPLTTTCEALAIRILIFLIFIIFILPFQLPAWSISNRKKDSLMHIQKHTIPNFREHLDFNGFPRTCWIFTEARLFAVKPSPMNCYELCFFAVIVANSCPKAKMLNFFLDRTGGASWEMWYRRCGGYLPSSWVQYVQLLTKTLEKWSVKKSALNPTQGPPSLFPIKGASISSASSSASSPAALPHTLAQRWRLENVTSFHMKLELIDHAFSFM